MRSLWGTSHDLQQSVNNNTVLERAVTEPSYTQLLAVFGSLLNLPAEFGRSFQASGMSGPFKVIGGLGAKKS